MCFLIAMISLVMCYNFFISDMLFASIGSLIVAIIFIFLMLKNIIFIRELKRKNKEKNDDN